VLSDVGSHRLPPHDLLAERSVLAAVLIGGSDSLAHVTDAGLTPEAFYRPAHADVFAAMLDLAAGGGEIDVVTVADHLERDRLLDAAGGRTGLMDLASTSTASPTLARARLPSLATAADRARKSKRERSRSCRR
jgi:replicative DNA helicase